MAGGLLPTIAELLTEVREDLDEALDTATNFWTDDYLLGRLNRGFRAVWTKVRETHENYFVRRLLSTDAPLTLYGRSYDPAQLAVTAGASWLVLPPDYAEALAFEAVPATGETSAPITFEWAGFASERFQDGRRLANDAQAVTYLIDVTVGEGGPRLQLSPTVASTATTVDTSLTYVYRPKTYAATDALEHAGFTREMLDAVVAYACLEARRTEGVATSITLAQGAWLEKLTHAVNAAGPRQSQAPEIVEGTYEEWWS